MSSEIERAIRERIHASEFAGWFGMEFVSAADGECEMRLELKPHHLNPGGIIHGGVIATMLDAAIGLALRSARPLGSPHVTLTMSIQYIGMASEGTIVARGRSLHAGRRAGHGEGELVTADGRMLAKGAATFMTVEPENLPRSPFA
ncbi:MAG TPA: PaaI family thioesterase [Actinomycetota bacterium]|nr:PaaI family thioesterase [Actinomycetota bacterium]